jgi:hypothetical protein
MRHACIDKASLMVKIYLEIPVSMDELFLAASELYASSRSLSKRTPSVEKSRRHTTRPVYQLKDAGGSLIAEYNLEELINSKTGSSQPASKANTRLASSAFSGSGAVAGNNSKANYSIELKRLIADGWTVLSEGPSGAQLQKKKRFSKQSIGAIAAGLLFILIFGVWGFVLGFVFVLAGVLDYLIAKPSTLYLSRH